MSNENTYPAVLCIDCTHLLANGEVESPDADWDEKEALENLKPGRVTLGELKDEDDIDYEDEGNEIDTFSREECYGCGTRTGGYRYKVTIWE